ncbi:MAG: helix-turn-helix transcriptional regulator [Acidimicrobiia bacterium]
MSTPTAPEELLLTAGQVAALFGVGRKTVNRWTQNGELPTATYTTAGHPRYRLDDLAPILATGDLPHRIR